MDDILVIGEMPFPIFMYGTRAVLPNEEVTKEDEVFVQVHATLHLGSPVFTRLTPLTRIMWFPASEEFLNKVNLRIRKHKP